ncbi:NF-kappa-B inhibitor cactus [Gryllus bimaculatus]|nr:NF-kappa-B inhibitor cactus [Gryllus bimaculatus]
MNIGSKPNEADWISISIDQFKAGVAVNAADFKGLTPLMTACMFGRSATAAFLLGMGAVNHLTDINGDTALHWAAYKGHPDLIRLLMYSGVDLQKPDNFGSTPLHLACLSGNGSSFRRSRRLKRSIASFYGISSTVGLSHVSSKEDGLPPVAAVSPLEMRPLPKAGLRRITVREERSKTANLTSVLFKEENRLQQHCVPITWNILRGSHYCFIYWNILMWLSWVIANRRDPGYVALNSDSYHRAIKQIPYFDKWKKRNIVLSRLCHTCRCLRPLRAKHCRICNRCVEYFDHHCPFIYNCVGLRNRMWFFLFVMSIAINCSFTIYFACYCIAIEGFEILYILGLMEALIFCGLGWILTCTSVLHACMNLTTNEMFNYKRYSYLRDKRGRYQNPFSRGPILNLLEFFVCTPDHSNDHDILEEEASI